MLLVILFVYFARVKFCHFPLGVKGCLRLVPVALIELFQPETHFANKTKMI